MHPGRQSATIPPGDGDASSGAAGSEHCAPGLRWPAPLAQPAEHFLGKEEALGSSPRRGSKAQNVGMHKVSITSMKVNGKEITGWRRGPIGCLAFSLVVSLLCVVAAIFAIAALFMVGLGGILAGLIAMLGL